MYIGLKIRLEKNMDIEKYLDKNNKIFTWPKKHENRRVVLRYLLTKFNYNTIYKEKEVNLIYYIFRFFF